MKKSINFAFRSYTYSFNSVMYYELYTSEHTASRRALELASAYNCDVARYYIRDVIDASMYTYVHPYYFDNPQRVYNGYYYICYIPSTREVIGITYHPNSPIDLFNI